MEGINGEQWVTRARSIWAMTKAACQWYILRDRMAIAEGNRFCYFYQQVEWIDIADYEQAL